MQKNLILIVVSVLILIAGCSNSNVFSGGNSPNSKSDIVENKGSDTIVNLALAWAEYYQEINPDIRISVTGGGSGTGIAGPRTASASA